MKVQRYDYLPAEAADIRKEVFIEEQGFEKEFDDVDDRAVHIVLFEGGQAAGTCRVYYSDIHKCHAIGRIAVRKEYRGKNLGTKIMRAAELEISQRKGALIGLSAQEQAMPFYQKLGYHPVGNIYQDEGCPHIWMEKESDCYGA